MTTIAKKASDLVKRMRRFLLRERKRDEVLSNLLDRLGSGEDVYLFGGIIRDIALYGSSGLECDIDLVWVGSHDRINAVVEKDEFLFRRNRFGGFRVKTNCWVVDLWRAEDTWAFRQGGRRYDGVESLLGTTITNWESILCRLEGCKLIHGENYFRDLSDGYLDVINDNNPNPLGMHVRILRAYACKDAWVLSSRTAQVLRGALQAYSFEDMSRYEREHYRVQYIGERVYELCREGVRSANLLPVELVKRNRNLSFW